MLNIISEGRTHLLRDSVLLELTWSQTGNTKDNPSIYWNGYLIEVIFADLYRGSPLKLKVSKMKLEDALLDDKILIYKIPK